MFSLSIIKSRSINQTYLDFNGSLTIEISCFALVRILSSEAKTNQIMQKL